jgi:tetratricopeptide (TPR) repeat protein
VSDESPSAYRAKLQRGQLLRSQERYAEAENHLQGAIGEEPNNPDGYYELAFCYCNWDGHAKKALDCIDRAIALDPNRSEFLALRAWILVNLEKQGKAIEAADEALAIDPHCILALNAKARAYVRLMKWVDAEEQSRRVLAIAAHNQLAANLLAIALRQQGRLQESEAVTEGLLSRAPDTAMSQNNAGWSALQAGDYQRANQHFLEALRLDPNDDNSRRGLLHSFNSRVWIYRMYFQVVSWIGRYRKEMRLLFFVLIYGGYRFVVIGLRTEFGREGINWSLVLVACYLVLFGFGKSFGNFFLLFDRFARHALTWKEKAWSLFAAMIYGFLLTSLIMSKAWPQAGVLIAIVGLFLWGVLQSRFRNAAAYRSSPSESPATIASR